MKAPTKWPGFNFVLTIQKFQRIFKPVKSNLQLKKKAKLKSNQNYFPKNLLMRLKLFTTTTKNLVMRLLVLEGSFTIKRLRKEQSFYNLTLTATKETVKYKY